MNFAFASWQGQENGKMFCSEFVARFYKKMGLPLFSEIADCDAISPGLLTYSIRVKPVWFHKV